MGYWNLMQRDPPYLLNMHKLCSFVSTTPNQINRALLLLSSLLRVFDGLGQIYKGKRGRERKVSLNVYVYFNPITPRHFQATQTHRMYMDFLEISPPPF